MKYYIDIAAQLLFVPLIIGYFTPNG